MGVTKNKQHNNNNNNKMSSSALTPEECLAYLQEYKETPPDFLQRNGSWLLSVIAAFSAAAGAVLTYLLRSRCRHIKIGCLECDRTPLNLESEQTTVAPQ